MVFDVFVSYSNKDKAIADAVVASLEENNLRCWYAPRDIQPSDDWGEAISNAIEKSKIFLIVFSGSANRSRHVLDELILAIDEEVTVLPFRVENLEPKGSMRLHLSSRHWLDAYDPSWKKYIQKLVQTVCTNLNIPYKEKEIEKSKKDIQVTAKTGKKKVTKLLAATGIGVILITAVWFGRTRLFGEKSEDQEITTSSIEVTPTKPIQEENQKPVLDNESITLGAWNEECQIAYVSILDETYSISLMQLDGSNQITYTDDNGDDIFPKWSHDGNRIAFLSNRFGSEIPWIFLIDASGANFNEFPHNTNNTENYRQFAWSPTSEQIAYVSNENGNDDIFIGEMGGASAITSDPSSDTNPTWSLNGKEIAFVSERDGGDKDIFVIDVESGNLNLLTPNSINDMEPAWSPTGERIAFTSDRSGNFDIFIMNPDGSGLRRLTDLGNNRYPAWSGDGNKLAFYSDRGGDFDVYVIDPDGNGIKRIIYSSNAKGLLSDPEDVYFSWSPDGTEIVFSRDNGIFLVQSNGEHLRKLLDTKGWYPVWSPICYKLE